MIGLNSGIDFSLPGNGGPDCLNFQTLSRRFFEAALSVIVCSICLYVGYVSHTPPQPTTFGVTTRTFNRIVEAAFFSMAVVYLLEVGYKFYSLQVIAFILCLHDLSKEIILTVKVKGGFNEEHGTSSIGVGRILECFVNIAKCILVHGYNVSILCSYQILWH